MQEAGEDFVIVDGRPYRRIPEDEHSRRHLLSQCGAALPHPRDREESEHQDHRQLRGAHALHPRRADADQFRHAEPVYALENGTQGWVLADLELERGASRRYPDRVDDDDACRSLQAQARALDAASRRARRIGARKSSAGSRIRSARPICSTCARRKNSHAGSLPGAVHAPGGQLVQATDQWVGVRNARIVLIDSEGVRAPVVASWLKQLGCDAYVLEGGTRAQASRASPRSPRLPALPP